MVILPVAPHLASVLVKAQEYGVLNQVIDIVSCLSVDNLLLNPPSEKRDEVNSLRLDVCSLGAQYGDLIMLKELYDIYNTIKEASERKRWCKEMAVSYKGFKNANRIHKQIEDYMNLLGDDHYTREKDNIESTMDGTDTALNVELILKSFLKGFILNTALGMPDRSYRTVTSGNLIAIHPSSLLFGTKKDAIMYIEFVYTVKGYARNVSAIKLDWLQEVAPQLQSAKVSTSNY